MIYTTNNIKNFIQLPRLTKEVYEFGFLENYNQEGTLIVPKKHFHSGVEIFIREMNSVLQDHPNIRHIITDLENDFLSAVSEVSGWDYKDISKQRKEDAKTKPINSFFLHVTLDSNKEQTVLSEIPYGHFRLTNKKIKELLTFKDKVDVFSISKFHDEIVVFYDDEGLLKEENFLISYDCLDNLKQPVSYFAGPIIFSINKSGVTYPFIETLDKEKIKKVYKTVFECARLF